MKRFASVVAVALATMSLSVFGLATPAHALAGNGSVTSSDEFSTATCTAVGLGVNEWVLVGTMSTNVVAEQASVDCWIHGGPVTTGVPTLLPLTKLAASSGSLLASVAAGVGTGDGTSVCVAGTITYINFPFGPPWYGVIPTKCSPI
jgi:hypothetical protein